MMEIDWKPSDWLGVITAGALWTPLSVEGDFAQNINNIVSQVQAVVRSCIEITDADAEEAATSSSLGLPADQSSNDDDELFSLDEMRQELERLRADGKQVSHLALKEDGEACALPSIIPEPQDNLVVSDSMQTLVDTVISLASKRRVGFWGTGGIGKNFLLSVTARASN